MINILQGLFTTTFNAGSSKTTSSSLHVKLRDLKKFSGPSPNSYNPQNAEKEIKKSEPSYSFGIKAEKGQGKAGCPAPNAYGVPPIKDSPAYSLAARAKDPKFAIVPGPGTYEVCHEFLTKKLLILHKYVTSALQC